MNVVPYFFSHGLPRMSVWEIEAHPKNEFEKTPSSFPPIVIVTSRVSFVTASSCGTTPADCEVKKSDVLAPLQVTSVNDVGVVTAAMSWAKLSVERLQTGGAVGISGLTPA
ncbi:MAG: hypothetical protein ABIW80_03815, partial [Lapillicoccus sp.]